MIVISILYTAIVISFIWARYRFFKVDAAVPKKGVAFNDLAVTIQILTTYYLMTFDPSQSRELMYLACVLYMVGLSLFWWGIRTAKGLDFASSNNVGSIVTTGPFKYVRHPFYVSYMLIWSGSTLLFNSLFLWITLLYLIAFYTLSARKEEAVIRSSVYSKEYEIYMKKVGMFLPRIKKWMPSSSET